MTAGEWQTAVLGLLETDPWERVEAADAVAAVLWDNPDVSPLELVALVAANMARVHYDDAGESDGEWADRWRAVGDAWYYRGDTTVDDMITVAARLLSLNDAAVAV